MELFDRFASSVRACKTGAGEAGSRIDACGDAFAVRLMQPKIYLAGPSVFDPDWEAQANAMKAACEARGAIGLYPKDNQADLPADPFARGIAIFEADRDLVLACDGVVADFSPFRGPSADVGTVWELAFAQGLGKAVAAFSTDRRFYAERLPEWLPVHDGRTIESFGMCDNLMLTGSNLDGDPARRAQTIGGFYGSFVEALDACLASIRRR
jgi:nucleoside 2-deoxyribosyltransferase